MEILVKYLFHWIFTKEIPDEISLGIIITGCNLKCPKCHSPHIWNKNIGRVLDEAELHKIIFPSQRLISCILFMGGEDRVELQSLILALQRYKKKIALYSGRSLEYFRSEGLFWLSTLNYLKVGHYDSQTGGLDNPNTNQKLYEIKEGKLNDITYKFWRE